MTNKWREGHNAIGIFELSRSNCFWINSPEESETFAYASLNFETDTETFCFYGGEFLVLVIFNKKSLDRIWDFFTFRRSPCRLKIHFYFYFKMVFCSSCLLSQVAMFWSRKHYWWYNMIILSRNISSVIWYDMLSIVLSLTI